MWLSCLKVDSAFGVLGPWEVKVKVWIASEEFLLPVPRDWRMDHDRKRTSLLGFAE